VLRATTSSEEHGESFGLLVWLVDEDEEYSEDGSVSSTETVDPLSLDGR
jgi:hypothetical protein